MRRRESWSRRLILIAAALIFGGATNDAIADGGKGGYSGGHGRSGSGSYYGSYYAAPIYAAPSVSLISPSAPVNITVEVPDPNAELTLDGNKTSSKGTLRYFQTPPLAPGHYTYILQATWMENGKKVTQTRKLGITPGDDAAAIFVREAGPSLAATK